MDNEIMNLLQQMLQRMDAQDKKLETVVENQAAQGKQLEAVVNNQAAQGKRLESQGEKLDALSERVTELAVTMENDLQRQVNLLLDGHKTLKEQMDEGFATVISEAKKNNRSLENMIVEINGKVLKLEERMDRYEAVGI